MLAMCQSKMKTTLKGLSRKCVPKASLQYTVTETFSVMLQQSEYPKNCMTTLIGRTTLRALHICKTETCMRKLLTVSFVGVVTSEAHRNSPIRTLSLLTFGTKQMCKRRILMTRLLVNMMTVCT